MDHTASGVSAKKIMTYEDVARPKIIKLILSFIGPYIKSFTLRSLFPIQIYRWGFI